MQISVNQRETFSMEAARSAAGLPSPKSELLPPVRSLQTALDERPVVCLNPRMNSHPLSRRGFVKRSALVAGAVSFPFISVRNVLGANSRLNIAGIGSGGKGSVDVGGCDSENIIALCDVDDGRAAGTFKKYPNAKRYRDFRVMLEKEKSIDAVTVSTPDHMHFPAAMWAMRMRKHVYCQKPLTHTIREARWLAEAARKYKVATQMGNQGHSDAKLRRNVELVQAGVLGQVREVHCWTDRPIWPQGISRPSQTPPPPIPEGLDWDLWLGVAPERPYSPAYVPFNWRGFWDFGTGALGDMGCHVMDMPFWALKLGSPTTVEAQQEGMTSESAPRSATITYEFPARGPLPPVKFVWYDGGRKPSASLVKGGALDTNGVILVGEKDSMIAGYWGAARFNSGATYEDFKSVSETLPKGSNFDRCHYEEWINACKGGPKAFSNFDNSGPLTETVLLGNVALRAGAKIEWDARHLKIKNLPEANRLLGKQYRKGWKV
jgi:predicted dehydrogenase